MGAPTNAKDLRSQGIGALKDGRFDAAAELLNRYLDAEPNDAEAELALAASRSGQGRHGAALVIFERQLEKNPRSPLLHFNRGTTLERMGKKVDAIQAYEQVLRLKPDHAKARQRFDILRGAARPNATLQPPPRRPTVQEEIPEVIAVDDDEAVDVLEAATVRPDKKDRWIHPAWLFVLFVYCVAAVGLTVYFVTGFTGGRVAGELLIACIFVLAGVQTIHDANRRKKNRPAALGYLLASLGALAFAFSIVDPVLTLRAKWEFEEQRAADEKVRREQNQKAEANFNRRLQAQQEAGLKRDEARMQEEAREGKRKLNAQEFDELLTSLRGDQSIKICDTCIQLKNTPPNDRRADVVPLLENLLASKDTSIRFWAPQALAKWGTRNSIAKLEALANDDVASIRTLAQRAIEEIEHREPPAAEKDK